MKENSHWEYWRHAPPCLSRASFHQPAVGTIAVHCMSEPQRSSAKGSGAAWSQVTMPCHPLHGAFGLCQPHLPGSLIC